MNSKNLWIHHCRIKLCSKGIKCFLDREVRAGGKFDKTLQKLIKDSNLVLVILTNAAVLSSWVNQEIGYAIAHKKPIWPIAIEKDIRPEGMLFTTQAYCLFDWSDPFRTIDRLVEALHSVAPQEDDYLKDLGFDLVLDGKIGRTRFLVSRLKELLRDTKRSISIRHQAAFSIFAASNDPMYKEASQHSDEYMNLLLEEREALNKLVHKPNYKFRLILWPVRAYEPKYLIIRYENLLRWLEEAKEDPTIDYVYTPYPGPNRLIISDEFCLEGYKLHNEPGYIMNLVKYQKKNIKEAEKEFDFIFKRASIDKSNTIRQIEKKYNEILRL